MTFEQRAATLKRKEIVELLASQATLTARVAALTRQNEWFKQQLFGAKSERRPWPTDQRQQFLGEWTAPDAEAGEPSVTVGEHQRRRQTKQEEADQDDEGGLRFDETVPVEEIRIPSNTPADDEHEVIGEKVTHRLAQRPGSYVVLKFVRPVIKRKDGSITCAPAPAAVLGKSYADVSLLAGLLVDKFTYHLPLYRQHQRMEAAGIRLARSTLTGLAHRSIDLLEPIYDAQLRSILSGTTVTMDETPIRAGRTSPGKMRLAYFWPVYGDRDEVVFPFSETRSGTTVGEVLGDYRGVLVTDGYQAYERHAERINGLVHAQCWGHARRTFLKAEAVEPQLSAQALALIRRLYEGEDRLRRKGLDGAMQVEQRALTSKPVVDLFFAWLKDTLQSRVLLPSNPFTEAAHYALDREAGLRVFLEYPNVPIDTNHLERQIRPIALGRKNWLFCWTELGAKYVGIVQSLLATCRLHEIDPYTYLVDVLQRVDSHPAADAAALTPRLWKERFAAEPLRSAIDRAVKNAAS